MGASLHLPIELTQFLGRPAPQTLLIRGAPGTGRTMLALELLDAFPGRRIYVTSRVGRSDLDLDFPTLLRSTHDGPITVVDLTAEGSDLRAASRALESARDLITRDEGHPGLRSLLLPPEVLDA